MKSNAILIILLISQLSFGQNQNIMELKINDLFFGLDLNKSPEEFVSTSKMNFDFGVNKIVGTEIYYYSTNFKSNPLIESEIKSGRLSIKYDNPGIQNGVFEATQIIRFNNEEDLLDEYNKLIVDFEKYSSKTIIETTKKKNYVVNFQHTEYQKEKDFKIPSLSFSFSNENRKDYVLIIVFTNSFKIDVLRKLATE